MRARPILAAVAIACVMGAAWAVARGPSDALTPNPTAVWLDGKDFVATKVTGYDPIVGEALLLGFDDGRFSASAGCNEMGGPYAIDGGRLVFREGVAQTMMGCASRFGDAEGQDEWLSGVLDGADIARRGDGLVIADRGDTIAFVPRVRLPAPVARRFGAWRLRAIRLRDGRAVSVANGRRMSVLLQESTGSYVSGCRFAVLDIEHREETLVVRRSADDTRRSGRCTARARPVDQAMTDVLRGTVSVAAGRGRLTLSRGGTSLVFGPFRASRDAAR